MDFEKDLAIDKYVLDEEWEKQPTLYHEWSKLLAEAEMNRDKVKQELDVLQADLDKQIRTDPKAFGLEKITESAIQSCILCHRLVKAKNDEFLTARYNVKIIQSAIESLNQKKYALDNLLRLWLGEYFSKPNIPQKAKEIVGDETRSSVRNQLKRL